PAPLNPTRDCRREGFVVGSEACAIFRPGLASAASLPADALPARPRSADIPGPGSESRATAAARAARGRSLRALTLPHPPSPDTLAYALIGAIVLRRIKFLSAF